MSDISRVARARQPHLLYVAWGYPPSRGSGVYRAWATANAFAANGWRVTVLTAPRETFTKSTGADLSLEQRVDPAIRIVRAPFKAPAFTNDLKQWSFWRAQAPELWNGVQNWRSRRAFPEANYGGWRKELEAAARGIHAEDPVDLTLGTANPNVDFIPGYTLFQDAGVPYVMDNRDAWQLDVFTGERLSAKGSAQDRWERKLIESAHRVWFVNEPIRAWHAEQYPQQADRFDVVENGYDTAPIMPPRTEPLPKAGLVFGYIGTISGAVPIQDILDGWERARSRSPLVRNSRLDLYGHLNHMGIPNAHVLAAMERFGSLDVAYLGPLTKAEVARRYADFDALVLMAGAGRYVTGGKAYEYAATGLPIASVHDPKNDTSRALADYPWWRGTPTMSAEDIADTVIAVAELAATQSEEQRVQGRVWAQRYERLNALVPWVHRLARDLGFDLAPQGGTS